MYLAKWYSVLFSDIRNKLGDQVVFSNWKGRGYMRTWVKPANPQTNKQQAHRDVMRKLVTEWKTTKKGDVTAVEVWNNYALDYGISGYNLFTKFGRKAYIEVPATASGTGSATVTVTYDFGVLGNDGLILIKKPDGTYDTLEPAELAGSVDYQATASGNYTFYVGSKKVRNDYIAAGGAGQAEDAARITAFKPDEANGIAKVAECEVTVA